ncbi:uncharacterized protein G2W53_027462 [Senna tora]|uniref:Uncharacterized protein n=1 Tax=Senna tora TaxID=362788 RepID=A0A834WGM5_9FABA|nr:uncharacterized protein G2W53_027462 [Senna tora]
MDRLCKSELADDSVGILAIDSKPINLVTIPRGERIEVSDLIGRVNGKSMRAEDSVEDAGETTCGGFLGGAHDSTWSMCHMMTQMLLQLKYASIGAIGGNVDVVKVVNALGMDTVVPSLQFIKHNPIIGLFDEMMLNQFDFVGLRREKLREYQKDVKRVNELLA